MKFPLVSSAVGLAALFIAMNRADLQRPDVATLAWDYGANCILLTVLFVVVSLPVHRLRNSRRSESASEYYTRTLPNLFREHSGTVIAAIGALVATTVSFTAHKVTVVGRGGFEYDLLFRDWDRWLFFGTDPYEITHAVFGAADVTAAIDFLYHPAYYPMAVGYFLCACLTGRPALRHTYMVSFLLSWVVIGMVLAGIFASAGPVYDGILFGDGGSFAALKERLARISEENALYSVQIQDYLRTAYKDGSVVLGGGISAMPSMHIVLAALFMLAGWHLNRWVGWILTAYTVLIWIGSVHLGWHYAVDGIVGVGVLLTIWYPVGVFFGLYKPGLIPAKQAEGAAPEGGD